MSATPSPEQFATLCRAALPDRRDLKVEHAEALGGYQHELWALEVTWAGRSRLLWTPPERERLILRLFRSPLTWWSTDDREKPRRELALSRHLEAAGLPVTHVYAAGEDTAGGLGPFALMRHADGAPWFSPGIDMRAVLTPLIAPHAEQLARLHAIPPDTLGDVPLPRRNLADTLDLYRAWAHPEGTQAHPEGTRPEVLGMAERLAEIAAGRPELPAVLVNGSPDFGNRLVEPDGSLGSWLDWEDSALADPRWDVAAVVAYLRVFKLADLGQQFVDRYHAAAGRQLPDLTLWLALIALRGWALTSWLAAQQARGTAPVFPGLDHWLFSLPRYEAAGKNALQRAEGWARFRSARPATRQTRTGSPEATGGAGSGETGAERGTEPG